MQFVLANNMTFFHSGRTYVVLGASNSPYKYGNTVLKWYMKQGLPVVPINPKSKEICGLQAYAGIGAYLESVERNEKLELSVSVVTAPDQSLQVFEKIKKDGHAGVVKSVWFQPGSYDSKVIKYLREDCGVDENEIIADGNCILVSGRYKLREAESLKDAN